MPPPPGAYNSTFTISGSPRGFDIRSSGYRWVSEANSTIRVIPWAQQQTIVVQSSGQKPWQRSYQVIFYSESDFVLMAQSVSAVGTLTTPREPGITAHLTRCERAEAQAPLDGVPGAYNLNTGPLTAVLTFDIVA